jgi:hypothetical protein
VIDEFAKEYLHDDLRWIREAILWKLDGLSEYNIRRPLTVTGTNLLGLIKHLATAEARYLRRSAPSTSTPPATCRGGRAPR